MLRSFHCVEGRLENMFAVERLSTAQRECRARIQILTNGFRNVVGPSRAPICEDRAKIVASDVLVCEMANRKVELRILTFQSAFHSLAGFL